MILKNLKNIIVIPFVWIYKIIKAGITNLFRKIGVFFAMCSIMEGMKLMALFDRVKALEAINAGPRLDAAEAAIAALQGNGGGDLGAKVDQLRVDVDALRADVGVP